MTDNVSIMDINDAFKTLTMGTDEPVMLHMVGAGTILPAMMAGALDDKTLTGHVVRRAFMSWDRMRTGEINPWECALCGKRRSGLAKLSCFAIIEHARGIGKDKPCIVAPVCGDCDQVSSDETKRRLAKRFGFPETQQTGRG